MASDVSDDERIAGARAARRAARRCARSGSTSGSCTGRSPRDAIARLLPPGLDVDIFDGTAYVGIVPFTIPLTRTARLGAPMAPAFHEINLRTYVHRGGRDPGVWFFSLDADQPAGRRGRAARVRAAVLSRRHHARGDGRRRRLPLAPPPFAGRVRGPLPADGPGRARRAGIARALPRRALPAVFGVRTRPAHRPRPPRAVPAAGRGRRRRRADADECGRAARLRGAAGARSLRPRGRRRHLRPAPP